MHWIKKFKSIIKFINKLSWIGKEFSSYLSQKIINLIVKEENLFFNIENIVLKKLQIVKILNHYIKKMFIEDLLDSDKRSTWEFFKECFL